jgi:hypothetical protein
MCAFVPNDVLKRPVRNPNKSRPAGAGSLKMGILYGDTSTCIFDKQIPFWVSKSGEEYLSKIWRLGKL